MKKIWLMLFLIITAIVAYGQDGSKNFIDKNYIEVIGHAEKQITPDEIYLKILINEKDIKGQSLASIEKLMIEKFKEMGIDISKQLEIKDFSSNFKNYWIIKSDIILTKEYQLLVYNAKTAGNVFIEMEKLGISNISIEKVDHSEIEKIKQEIKIDAIKSAKEKACALANAIGQNVGRALYIYEYSYNVNTKGGGLTQPLKIMVRGNTRDMNNMQEEAMPTVEFEKIELEYNISVRFELN